MPKNSPKLLRELTQRSQPFTEFKLCAEIAAATSCPCQGSANTWVALEVNNSWKTQSGKKTRLKSWKSTVKGV